MSLKKVSYGTIKIQKMRRIALDPNLLETLGLEVGDSVRIELDVEREAIVITRGDASMSDAVLITRRGKHAQR